MNMGKGWGDNCDICPAPDSGMMSAMNINIADQVLCTCEMLYSIILPAETGSTVSLRQ
jgi:hypothetical protein